MWNFEQNEEFGRRYKRYEKKHPRELKAILSNLNVVQKALCEGANPQRLPFGFIHIEQRGVLAVDQKGGGKALAETRLYIYLDRETETIHLITLGDKNSQREDVKTSSEYVADLTKTKDKGDDG